MYIYLNNFIFYFILHLNIINLNNIIIILIYMLYSKIYHLLIIYYFINLTFNINLYTYKYII